MQVKKYNVSKPEKYMKGNEEKTYWANVGTMTEFHKEDGISRILEIPAIGLKANIFLIEPKETQTRTAPKKEASVQLDEDYPEEDINPEDIPF